MEDSRIESVTASLQRLPIVVQVVQRLTHELPVGLLYHSCDHTRDVLAEVVRFGVIDGLTDRELELLAVAAAYHDAGFLVSTTCNEPIGAAMAVDAMRSLDSTYTAAEGELVKQMILDTALQQTPAGPRQVAHTELSKYLLDADLSNLGRADFFERGELQRRELAAEPEPFWRATLTLLETHQWLTPAAQQLRSAQKASNLATLRAEI